MFQLLPKHSAASILQSSNKHKKKQDKKKQVGPEEEKPGTESVRKNRENFTRYMYTVCRELEFSSLSSDIRQELMIQNPFYFHYLHVHVHWKREIFIILIVC